MTYEEMMAYVMADPSYQPGGASGEWGGYTPASSGMVTLPDGRVAQMTAQGQLRVLSDIKPGHGQDGGGANESLYGPGGVQQDLGWNAAGDGDAWKRSLAGALAVGVGGPLAGYSAGLLSGAAPAAGAAGAAGGVAAEEALMASALSGTAGTTGWAAPAAAAGAGGMAAEEALMAAAQNGTAGTTGYAAAAPAAAAAGPAQSIVRTEPATAGGTGAPTVGGVPSPGGTQAPVASGMPDWFRQIAPWAIPALGAVAGAAGADGTESTSVRELPAWAQDSGRRFLQQAETVAGRPYQDYQGPRVAGWNEDQQTARNLTRTLADQGNPAVNQAQQQQQQNISGTFMNRPEFGATTQVGTNPWLGKSNEYLQPSIDMAVGDVARNFYDNTIPGIQGGFNQGGGNNFFNTGRILQEEKAREGAARTAGDISTNMRVADRAQQIGMSESDVTRRLSASQTDLQRNLTGLLSGLGIQQDASQFAPNWQTADLNRANALSAAGGARNTQDQNAINADMSRWDAAWNYPNQQLQTWQQGFQPTQQTGSTTLNAGGTNPWLAAAGGAAAGLGTYQTGRQYGWW